MQQYGLCLKTLLPEVGQLQGTRRGGTRSPAPHPPRRRRSTALHQLEPAPIPAPLRIPPTQVEKGVCEREFQSLKVCWRTAFRAALAKSRGPK